MNKERLLKAYIAIMKDTLPNMKEIKELLLEIKKSEKLSEGEENSVNDEKRRKEDLSKVTNQTKREKNC